MGDLAAELAEQLEALERNAAISPRPAAAARFRFLIKALHERTGQPVVVLVDEYDKPILDALDVPEVARANRDLLRGLYGVVKDCDAHVRFAFLAGVSKFSKVSLFSGLNNLTDITLDPRYAAVCGYTDTDLDTVFAPELRGLDRDAIRTWYNGYNWRGAESVYNPFDILLLFDRREFDAWWFETGTPTFLVDTLLARAAHAPDLALDNCRVVVACLKHARPTLHCGDPLALRGRGDPAGAADAGWRHQPERVSPGTCAGSSVLWTVAASRRWRAARRPCAVCTARDASICRPRAMAAAPVTAVRVGSASRSRNRKQFRLRRGRSPGSS